MIKMLQSKVVEVVEDLEPEPKVDNPESGPKVVELITLQEEISLWFTEVVELSIETHIDLLEEPALDLIPSSAVIRASLFLRSPDMYDPLQIFLHEAGSQEISALICGSIFSRTELTCHTACILVELLSTATCLSRKPVSPPSP